MRELSLPTRPAQSLIETSRQFEHWRGTRPRGERIPAALWRAALDLARSHGVSKTSQALRLDYYSVQRRLAEVPIERSEASAQQFVEIEMGPGVTSPPSAQCRLEMRDNDGSAVRLEFSGWSVPDLATLVRTVLGRDQR